MENRKIRVGITHGDISGVGYEIILKTFAEPAMFEICTPVVYGSPKAANFHRKNLESTTNFHAISSAAELRENRLNLVSCFDDEISIDFGIATEEGGNAAYMALERAMAEYADGLIDVLVTAPINKKAIQSVVFHFHGHTEYIEAKVGGEAKALMILMNENIRVALASTHLPLKEVPTSITKENIEEKLVILNHTLRQDFLINNPRIAVLSLNPHAGEDTLLGNEEKVVIIPAIAAAEEKGIHCFGPYPADGFFGSGMFCKFDAVLAMYHDQGLIPFKTLAMNDGVNYTAGLPIVRTSPAHGTAYDIAGKGIANESSFRQSIYAAIDILRNRKVFAEAHKNPLRKIYNSYRDDSDKLKLDTPEEV